MTGRATTWRNIAFGLRLAVGREALGRLAVIAAAVAIGVGMLLATVAGSNAVTTQNDGYAWLNTGLSSVTPKGPAAPDPVWWYPRADYVAGRLIGRIEVAPTGPHAPVPPGLPRLPAQGEYYASPALAELLRTMPADQLAGRFPGHLVGTIGRAGQPAPDTLIIIIGGDGERLAHTPGAKLIDRIADTSPVDCIDCLVGYRADAVQLILGVVAVALLFPVLIFIGSATRLAAARREQRFAAMRLVGATPRQVTLLATVESTVAAALGTLAGFGVFFALRTPLAAVPFTGAPFFPDDLSLTFTNVMLVVFGVPVGAAVAAWLALRRVRITPLGVSRRATPKPPRAFRLVPLVAGIAELAYFVGRRPHTSMGQLWAFLSGEVLVMIGLVLSGPWLTMVGARLLARRSARPATIIAARRLADDPKAGFRAVSGVVLALFVTTVAIAVISTITSNRSPNGSGTAAATTLVRQFEKHGPTDLPGTLLADVRAVPGVRSVTQVRVNPIERPAPAVVVVTRAPAGQPPDPGALPGLALCSDLAGLRGHGTCPAGATVVEVWDDLTPWLPGQRAGGASLWRASTLSAEEFARQPVYSLVVVTDGSTAAIERARTVLENAFPNDDRAPATDEDYRADFTNLLAGWQRLANVIILVSLPIAGCSLAVSVVGGLAERKRPFSLLRLTGVPVRTLRRVVTLESAVPLLVMAAVAIGFGLLAAYLFLRAQLQYALEPPGWSYYLAVGTGLVTSLAVIASTMPWLERITGPETARND